MEDKQAICDQLLELINATREKDNIQSITYSKRKNGDEYVIVRDWNRVETIVDVTADSGMAMIKDVFNKIYQILM